MMIWTWRQQEYDWISRMIAPGERLRLNSDAVAWRRKSAELFLLASPRVVVNGQPAFPVQVLADRDEIRAGADAWCVSFDSVPAPERFVRTDLSVHCMRCQGGFSEGDLTIACPQCGAHYHQTETLPCWSYDQFCGRCRRSTGTTIWQPEPLYRPRRKVTS